MARHYLPGSRRLSLSLVLPDPCVRETYLLHAGKMFFACKANIISACGKNVFYRIDRHPPEAAGAARLTACGRGPRARPCGRTARPAGDGNALTGDLTAWRPARPAGETIPLNQEPRTKARGRRGGAIMHRNQAGGWTCSGVRGPALPMSPAAPAPDPAPADPAPALLLWPCRCSCSCS